MCDGVRVGIQTQTSIAENVSQNGTRNGLKTTPFSTLNYPNMEEACHILQSAHIYPIQCLLLSWSTLRLLPIPVLEGMRAFVFVCTFWT